MPTINNILLVCFIAELSWKIPELSVGAQEYDGYVATISLTKGEGRHEFDDDIKAITIYQAGEISSTANIQAAFPIPLIQVISGDNIALRCKLEAHGTWFLDNDVRQEWEFRDNDAGRETISRNGKKVIENKRIKVKENRDKYEWTVILKNTKKSDSGRWNCFISPDRFGTRVVARANVQIFDTLASTKGPPLEMCNTTEETVDNNEDASCEQISKDNQKLCPVLPYHMTSFPNLFGHQTQSEVYDALATILSSMTEEECSMQEFACATFIPPCNHLIQTEGLILPCRSVCEKASSMCDRWPVIAGLECDRFPENIDTYNRCWEPSNAILGDRLPCQQVPVPICHTLGFKYTAMQDGNPFKHVTLDEAVAAFNDEHLQMLMTSGCSDELASFVCAAFFPPCHNGEVTKLCNKVCRRIWKSCKHHADSLGIPKHDIFQCTKRYPRTPPDEIYSSYYDTHEKCLMNVEPPKRKPTITDIARLRTSITFHTSSEDGDVAAFLVSTYRVKLPESTLHASPISQYNAYKLSMSASTQDWQGDIQIGDPDVVPGSTPLESDSSYFITIQAQNTFGTGPMTIVALPKYDAQRIYFYSSVTPERVNWLDESDHNLTYFRLQYHPNQIVCVNLDTGNQNSPAWGKEDCIVPDETDLDDVTKISHLSTEMTLLKIGSKDNSWPYTCSIPGLQSSIITSPTSCVKTEHFLCKSYGAFTVLPNKFGHTTQKDAELASYRFLPLLYRGCSNYTSVLEAFVCSAYLPAVDSCEVDTMNLIPCKEDCRKAFDACQSSMGMIDFEWPAEALCDNFPSLENGDKCYVPGQSADVAPNDEPDIIDTNNAGATSTNQTIAPCSKPRRYDVIDMGISYLYRGWADVQGQGAANDFCRVVRINNQEHLSCALAGTTGENQYNYNSPNMSRSQFNPGYMDTWYMRDEDMDGRDDYCRCVGHIPDTYVSCMRAGQTGFDGHDDFKPELQKQPCHFFKVNPVLGPGPIP